jgi:NADH:ubiquinone oxidoreductase subunit 4 (subunit M)
MTLREFATLAPLAVIVIVLGVYPMAVLDLINASLVHLNQTVLAAVPAAAIAAR